MSDRKFNVIMFVDRREGNSTISHRYEASSDYLDTLVYEMARRVIRDEQPKESPNTGAGAKGE